MRKSTSRLAQGFTIVELLIVIVVIAILAAITIVAFNGVQTRANNTARISTGNEWVKVFQIYKAQEGDMPPQLSSAPARICLGSGFPIGGGGVPRCQNVTGTDTGSPAESDNAAVMAELANKLGPSALPSAKPIPAHVTGPYLQISSSLVVIGVQGTYTVGGDCGGGFRANWAGSGIATCVKSIQ